MGAGQSSQGGPTSTTEVELKTSYYELLGVERTATDDELKKAYRRKALELHPDKNRENEAAATQRFAEVQAAYEVLSDPHERAWYDSHERDILSGGTGADTDAGRGPSDVHFEQNVRFTTAEEILATTRKFNRNVDFSDAASGFYGFLRDLFDRLATEERIAATTKTGGYLPDDHPEYPPFGHAADTHDDVVRPFYAAWAGFSTAKSFAWRDKYRLSEARDRRYRRAMEKENRRLREEAAWEFNDAVRTLVAFVKKRDPRYQANAQTEEERGQALRAAARAQAARARAAHEEKIRAVGGDAVPEWARSRDEEEETDEVSEEEVVVEEFECVVCQKRFKSEKQVEAHEKSKKHLKAVQQLRREMRAEGLDLGLEGKGNEGTFTPMDDEDAAGVDAAVDIEENELDGPEIDEALDSLDIVDTQPSAPAESPNESSDEDPSEDPSTLPTTASPPPPLSTPTEPAEPPAPKLGKAAQKRAKRAAAAAAADSEELKFKCAVCQAAFPSKTRMFQHIKDFDHAALKSAGGVGGSGKGGKKRR